MQNGKRWSKQKRETRLKQAKDGQIKSGVGRTFCFARNLDNCTQFFFYSKCDCDCNNFIKYHKYIGIFTTNDLNFSQSILNSQ